MRPIDRKLQRSIEDYVFKAGQLRKKLVGREKCVHEAIRASTLILSANKDDIAQAWEHRRKVHEINAMSPAGAESFEKKLVRKVDHTLRKLDRERRVILGELKSLIEERRFLQGVLGMRTPPKRARKARVAKPVERSKDVQVEAKAA